MAHHARWYVNVSKWKPTKEEWLKLTSSIAEEELDRVNKFIFKDDAKSSLVGRVLIRKFLTETTGTPSNEIILTRNAHGRPEIHKDYKLCKTLWPPMIDFNISHSGDYCVLAGIWSQHEQPVVRVGVDVTKIVKKNTKQELDRFLDLMSRRPFTKDEWKTVEKPSSDRQKCVNFTRLWCLKECFIKAIGLGLSFKLQRIDFAFPPDLKYDISTEFLKRSLLGETAVKLDGHLAKDWRFYETALDDEHLVAIGYNILGEDSTYDISKSPFDEISIESIVRSIDSINEVDEKNWIIYSSRELKPEQ